MKLNYSSRLTAILTIGFYLLLSANLALTETEPDSSARNQQGGSMAFTISSPSFQNGAQIPKKFACDGEDISPELQWTPPAAGTKSLALIVDDPDAPVGTWTHWVLYDLPPQTTSLSENVKKQEHLPTGAIQGRNDFRKIGYGGPCPPAGKAHRYFFKLYALDKKLDLKPGASKQEVERGMQGHILAQAELMGKYQR